MWVWNRILSYQAGQQLDSVNEHALANLANRLNKLFMTSVGATASHTYNSLGLRGTPDIPFRKGLHSLGVQLHSVVFGAHTTDKRHSEHT